MLFLILVRRSESVYWIHACGSDSAAYHTHCNTKQNTNISGLLLKKSCRLLCAALINQCSPRLRFAPFFSEHHGIPSFSPSLSPSLTASPPHFLKLIVSYLISPLAHYAKALGYCMLLGHFKCGYFEFPRILTYADVPWGFEKNAQPLLHEQNLPCKQAERYVLIQVVIYACRYLKCVRECRVCTCTGWTIHTCY